MSSAVETTLKALKEFESELEAAKMDTSDAKKKLIKEAGDLADSAKATALARAQEISADRVSAAKEAAEKEAAAIRKKGDDDLAKFESSISRRKAKAADWVVEQLMGGGA